MNGKIRLIIGQREYVDAISKRYGVSYSKIAEVAELSDTTLTRFMNRPVDSVNALGAITLKKIEDKFPPTGAVVYKSGLIAKGYKVTLLAKEEKLNIELPPQIKFSPNLKAWEFIDNENAPLTYKGWLYITYAPISPTPESRFAESPYWIELTDKSILFARISKGYEAGRYNLLHPLTGAITENCEIKQYAEIAHIIPSYNIT